MSPTSTRRFTLSLLFQIQSNIILFTILSTNVRSLPKKVEEIQQIAELNSAGAICITESWLSTDIPDSCVAIPGFNLFRKDRIYAPGGGVCIYLDQKIPCKLFQSCDQEEVESLWISMRPHSLPRQITSMVLSITRPATANPRMLFFVIIYKRTLICCC